MVLRVALTPLARDLARSYLAGIYSYFDALRMLQRKADKQAEEKGIVADTEAVSEIALDDAIRVMRVLQEDSISILSELATAMHKEGMSESRISQWVRKAGIMHFPDHMNPSAMDTAIASVVPQSRPENRPDGDE